MSVLGMIVDARRLAPLIDGLRIVGETAIAKVVNGISMRGDGYIVVLAELAESARVTPAVFNMDAVR